MITANSKAVLPRACIEYAKPMFSALPISAFTAVVPICIFRLSALPILNTASSVWNKSSVSSAERLLSLKPTLKAYYGSRIFCMLKTPCTKIRKLRQERTSSIQNHSAILDLIQKAKAELHPFRAKYDLSRILALYHYKTSLSIVCKHLFVLNL